MFSDDESSSEESGPTGSHGSAVAGGGPPRGTETVHVGELQRTNGELRRQSETLLVEVDKWRGKVDELQEKIEESEQSWSHEQHRRKSQWEGERALLERSLREWAPMAREDERALLQREILETVSRARAALAQQGAELVRCSEQLAEENGKLEDRARAQALCLEQQQGAATQLHAEVMQLSNEALSLREAEARGQEQQRLQAESAVLEQRAAASLRTEFLQLREEARDAQELETRAEALRQLEADSAAREQEHRRSRCESDAQQEAVLQGLQAEAESAKFELQAAADLLLSERSECNRLEGTCQRLGEELSERQSAQGSLHDRLEAACQRLEGELADTRRQEALELARLGRIHHQLEEESLERQRAGMLQREHLETACSQLEEELLESHRAGKSESLRMQTVCRNLEEEFQEACRLHRSEKGHLEGVRQQLEEELLESRHAEGSEYQRLEGVCSQLGEELQSAVTEMEEPAKALPVRRASGTFAALACAYAAAAAAYKLPVEHEPMGEGSPRRASGTQEALMLAYQAAAAACRSTAVSGEPDPNRSATACPTEQAGLASIHSEHSGALGTASPARQTSSAVAAPMHHHAVEQEAAGSRPERWLAREELELRMRTEAEVAESRRAVAQLRAELATEEAERVWLPSAEQRVAELELRCEASAAEVLSLRARLEEAAAGRRRPAELHGAPSFSEALLAAALKRKQACGAWSASLSAAHVEVIVPLRTEVDAGASAAAAHRRLRVAMEEGLGEFGVGPLRVELSALKESLRCAVHIHGRASVRAVAEALAEVLQQSAIQAVLAEAGAGGAARVAPRWPLERLQAEIEFEYGYMLTLSQLEKLVPVVSESYRAYRRAWQSTASEAPGAVAALAARVSMARFEGELLSVDEGRQRQLLEDWMEQGASQLGDLVADAARAQLCLKGRLASGTAWAQTDLSNMFEVPRGHASRIWHSSAGDPLPSGTHHDPGVESHEQLLERARCQMMPLDVDPRVEHLVDISGLGIVFESAEDLHRGVAWITEHFDVLWVHNRFRNPSCLGLRDMSIGVTHLLPTGDASGSPQRAHVSELRLSLKQLDIVGEGEGQRLFHSLRSTLAQCGVRLKDIDGVQSIVLRVLERTDGRTARDALWDLRHTVQALEVHAGCMTEAASLLAGDLRREAWQQAVSAGLSEEELAHAEEAAMAAARRTAVRCACGGAAGGVRAEVPTWCRAQGSEHPGECERLQARVGGLQMHCEQLQRFLAAREAENEELMAEVLRLRSQAASGQQERCQAGKTPESPSGTLAQPNAPTSELDVALSELAEARTQSRRIEEGEAAHAERHLLAEESAERVQRQMLFVEARAFALGEELKQWQAQAMLPQGQATGRNAVDLAGLAMGPRSRCDLLQTDSGFGTPARERQPGAVALALRAAGSLEVGPHPEVCDLQHDRVPGQSLTDLGSTLSLGEALRSSATLSPQRSHSSSPTERRRLAGLAQSSAAAVAVLLRQVRGLSDARAVLASGSADGGGGWSCGRDADAAGACQLTAVRALERQTCQLELTNHEWASSLAARSSACREWAVALSSVASGSPCEGPGGARGARDCPSWASAGVQRGALPDAGGVPGAGLAGSGLKCSPSHFERGAALTTALQHTARRLESLHGRLKDLSPSETAELAEN